MRSTLALAVLMTSVVACQPGAIDDAVPSECAAIGARCQREDGPIGVCQMTKCDSGETPPCYACTPQH